MPTEIILIRHGLTEWNLKKKYCGAQDIGLHAEGKIQARRIHRRLKGIKLSKVYSSSAKRAMQTAKIVFRKCRIEKTPELKEMDFGCFEGMTHVQIMKKYPRIYRKWLHNPFCVTVPGGESLTMFRKRVVSVFKRIASKHNNETIAVVSHGGAISIFIAHILKSANDFWKRIPHSASISIIEYQKGGSKVKLFSDVSHLGGTSRTT